VGARFSAPVQAGPEAMQPSVQWLLSLLAGVKRPGRGVNHPHSEVK
jgi:hypothetical protein